jgi:predicted ATPase/DNA-binding SARP family transcriptional activator
MQTPVGRSVDGDTGIARVLTAHDNDTPNCDDAHTDVTLGVRDDAHTDVTLGVRDDAHTDVTLGVLGPLVLYRGGSRPSLGGPKARQILATLVANRGRGVSGDRLVDTLWGAEPPRSAPASVQSHISRLRKVLNPAFEIRHETGGYRLVVHDADIDADRFEDLLARSRDMEPAQSADLLDDALSLWRGPAFGDDGYFEHVRAEAVRLDELRLVATDEWVGAKLACGDAAPMVGELEALVEQHPLRESFRLSLMIALHHTGRQAEALRRAAEFREMLGAEVGLDASAAVGDLESRILADDPSLRPTAPATGSEPAGAVSADSTLLGPTSFVGRDPEVANLAEALRANPVVTVTGPGGVGKTRLAMRAAAHLSPDLGGNVTVVEFAALRDPDGVGRVLAHALDVQQRQARTLVTTIEEYLAPRRALLVLDNCEHVTGAVAPLVDRLRSSCPQLRILATSRQPLGLAGEFVVVVSPLSLPAGGADSLDEIGRSTAVQLFAARAAAAVPGFELDEENAGIVAGICRRVDGLPLGLELAAARLRAMGIVALAERLDQRVQSLGRPQRSRDGRQRSLVELVRWSHDLLDPRSRRVFAELAVFAGGFDLTAAEAVCGAAADRPDPVDTVADLVEQSMVILTDPRVPRYRLLEPLREFGLDRLADSGDLDTVEVRHLAWFVDLAQRGAQGLDTPEEPVWSARFDRDFDNLRAAHLFSLRSADTDRGLRLVAALREFGFRSVQYEVMAWAAAAADLPGADEHPDYPTILAMCAYGHWVRGDLDAAISLAGQALETGRADAISHSGLPERVLGNAHFYKGDLDTALMWMDRMLESARTAGDTARVAHALYMHSVAYTSIGDGIRGAVLAGEAKAAATAVGSTTARSLASYALGLALERTDTTEALANLETAAHLGASAGNRWIGAFALTEVHWLRARSGEHLAALEGYTAVVRTWYRGGDWANQWLSLRHVFGILTDLGAFEVAAVLHGALVAAGAAHALPFEPADAQRLADTVDELRSLLGTDAFEGAVARGAAMSDSEIVDFVIHHMERLTTAP